MLLAAFALAGCESAEDQEIRALIDEIAAIQEQTIAAMEASAAAKDEEARERVVGNESWPAEMLARVRADRARNDERSAAQRAEQLEDSRRGGREGLTKLRETLASGDWETAYPREMARVNGSALALVTSLRDRAESGLRRAEAARDHDMAWRERKAEDTLELQLRRPNCVRFEARGLSEEVTIRDLVRHSLRHRPDHIVVGEVRGAEAADLLQALNTGHGGSLATVHANNAEAALSRLAGCAMQASDALPWSVVCRGVVDGIEAVIHQTRTPTGERKVAQMVRVQDYDAQTNRWVVEPIWPTPAAAREQPAAKPSAKASRTPSRRRKGRRRAR
jgi:hypothetical protein